MMKRKYERPKMEACELKLTSHLLTMSNPGNYGNGGDPLSSPAPMLMFNE